MLTVEERWPNVSCEGEEVVVRGASCDYTLQEGQEVETRHNDHGGVS